MKSVLREGNTYYVCATDSSGRNISLASSTDLVKWKILGRARPARDQAADKQFGGVAKRFVVYHIHVTTPTQKD